MGTQWWGLWHSNVPTTRLQQWGTRGHTSVPSCVTSPVRVPVPADAPWQRLREAQPGQPRRGGRQRPCHPHQAGGWWRWQEDTGGSLCSLCPLTVPCPQSFLLKRSGNSLNKEWKKKYVTLSSNGLLFYHPSINVSVPIPLWSPRCGRARCDPRCPPRTTSTAPTGRRWICCAPRSRCPGSARPAPSLPAAPRPASTGCCGTLSRAVSARGQRGGGDTAGDTL